MLQVFHTNTLRFEGDISQVIQAVQAGDPALGVIHTGGGMGGATSTGYAAALEARQLRHDAPFVGASVSVGVVNQMLVAYQCGSAMTQCYAEDFCSSRFIKSGIMPWFLGTKVSVRYYGAVLRHKMKGRRPHHPDSQIRIGVTNYESGEAVVLTPDLCDTERVAQAAMASACLPCSGKGYVTIDGVPYTDGGLVQPIPLQSALAAQPKFLLIIMATPEGKPGNKRSYGEDLVCRWTMSQAPRVIQDARHNRHQLFDNQLAYIRKQMAIPMGDPGRALPPVCLVWPKRGISMVEQRAAKVRQTVESSSRDWQQVLSMDVGDLQRRAA